MKVFHTSNQNKALGRAEPHAKNPSFDHLVDIEMRHQPTERNSNQHVDMVIK